MYNLHPIAGNATNPVSATKQIKENSFREVLNKSKQNIETNDIKIRGAETDVYLLSRLQQQGSVVMAGMLSPDVVFRPQDIVSSSKRRKVEEVNASSLMKGGR